MGLFTRTAAIVTGVLAISAATQAALIVDYGGTGYVPATTVFANGSTGSATFGGFSGGDPIQISPTSGYSGPTFHGWVNWTVNNGGSGVGAQIVDDGGGDRIELKRGRSNNAGVVLFKQNGFLNGLNSGNVGFDATSTASVFLNTFALISPGRVVIRLQGGSQDGYYISQQTPFDGSGTTKSTPLTSLTWLTYNPATDIRAFGTSTNLLQSGTIGHVTEVGFYFQNAAGALNDDNVALRLNSFEVSAVAVPEPMAGALLLPALLMVRRRSA